MTALGNISAAPGALIPEEAKVVRSYSGNRGPTHKRIMDARTLPRIVFRHACVGKMSRRAMQTFFRHTIIPQRAGMFTLSRRCTGLFGETVSDRRVSTTAHIRIIDALIA